MQISQTELIIFQGLLVNSVRKSQTSFFWAPNNNSEIFTKARLASCFSTFIFLSKKWKFEFADFLSAACRPEWGSYNLKDRATRFNDSKYRPYISQCDLRNFRVSAQFRTMVFFVGCQPAS